MGQGHSHALPRATSEKTRWLALGLTSTFLVAEVIGGLVTGSLALLSDAAHMFTDAAALAIALAAVRIARRAADLRRSYGYHRFEILAAAFNALLLFGVAISSMKRGNGCASPPRSRPRDAGRRDARHGDQPGQHAHADSGQGFQPGTSKERTWRSGATCSAPSA